MINLNENYRVLQQPLNLVLQERRYVKQKDESLKETWAVLGFYPDIKQLKQALVFKKINDVVGNFTKLDEITTELLGMIKTGV